MANKTRGGGSVKSPDNNVISLFGGKDGAHLVVEASPEEEEKAKELMVGALEGVIKSIRSGETDGIILIGVRSGDSEFGAESYFGGKGVFGNMDRAVGLMELVKFDLVSQVRRTDFDE